MRKKRTVKSREKKKSTVTFAKTGNGDFTTRVSIPRTWFETLGINSNEKDIYVELNQRTQKITITKVPTEQEDKED